MKSTKRPPLLTREEEAEVLKNILTDPEDYYSLRLSSYIIKKLMPSNKNRRCL